MSRFCGTLSLPRDVQKAATHIAKNAVDLDIVPGRSPISVAAAAIYMASQASDDKRPQREIADIAGNPLSTLYGSVDPFHSAGSGSVSDDPDPGSAKNF